MTDDERRAMAIAAVEADIEWEDRTDNERREWRKYARAIRASDEAAGMVLVPKVPTKAMIEAGETALDDATDSSWDSGPDGEGYNSYNYIIPGSQTAIYKAMIAAYEGTEP